MKKLIISTLAIFTVLIGLSAAYAEQITVFVPFDDVSGWYCQDPADGVYPCFFYEATQQARENLKDVKDFVEKIQICTDPNEFIDGICTEPDAVPTPPTEEEIKLKAEADRLGISDEALLQLNQKRLEQEGQRIDEIIAKCEGGKEQARLFQTPWHIEMVMDRIRSIADWENLTVDDKKKIAECEAIFYTRMLGNAYYPNKVINLDQGFKALDTEHYRDGIFATDETKLKAHNDAVETIKTRTWMSQVLDEPFADLVDPTVTWQRSEADRKHAEAEAARQQIKADEKSLTQNCNSTWKNTGYGQSTPEWWPSILIDGTCDGEIKGIAEQRGDYKRIPWDNQTPENCPDCDRFN